MKTILSILLISFIQAFLPFKTIGQCIANAGNDTTVCITYGLDTVRLGRTAKGGRPPYTYAWTCDYVVVNHFFLTASDFLDDPTLANPRIIDYTSDSLTFYLTVTDSEGNRCSDDVTVRFCGNYAWTLDWKFARINKGDTAQLAPSVANGCSPLNFQWFPKYNISDPNIRNPLVWPDTTTHYYSIVTDSAGCQATGGTFDVFIKKVSTEEQTGIDNTVKIFPNPLIDRSIITTNSSNNKIIFYDILGRNILETIGSKSIEIKREYFKTTGIYFFVVWDDNKILGNGKLMVQ
jgi:hypothetical protein